MKPMEAPPAAEVAATEDTTAGVEALPAALAEVLEASIFAESGFWAVNSTVKGFISFLFYCTIVKGSSC